MLLAMVDLLEFQTLDGREVHINPAHIVSVSNARDESNPDKWLVDKAHCVITLSNGKFITVSETCDDIRQRLAK